MLYDFEQKLRETAVAYFEDITDNISKSDLSTADKDFLILNMKNIKYISYDKVSNEYRKNIDNYNNQCAEHAKSYPESSYNSFVTEKMPYKEKPSIFGAQVTVFWPSIASYPTFENEPVLGRGAEAGIIIYRFAITGTIFSHTSNVSRDIMRNPWVIRKKGTRMTMTHNSLSLGYIVLDKNLFRITPFVFRGHRLPANGVGINMDIKFLHRLCAAYKPFCTFPALRIQYQYIPNALEKIYRNESGKTHILSIGLNITEQNTKRIKK